MEASLVMQQIEIFIFKSVDVAQKSYVNDDFHM